MRVAPLWRTPPTSADRISAARCALTNGPSLLSRKLITGSLRNSFKASFLFPYACHSNRSFEADSRRHSQQLSSCISSIILIRWAAATAAATPSAFDPCGAGSSNRRHSQHLFNISHPVGCSNKCCHPLCVWSKQCRHFQQTSFGTVSGTIRLHGVGFVNSFGYFFNKCAT